MNLDHKTRQELETEIHTLKRELDVLRSQKQEDAPGAFSKEKIFKAVMEGVEEALFVKDLESRYVQTNPTFCRGLEMAEDEILGRTDEEIFGGETANEFVQTDRQVIDERRPMTFEGHWESPEGRRYWICTKVPLFEGEQVVGVLGFNRDVTELRNAQLALEKRTLELEDFIDNAMEGIHWVGSDGKIQRVNQTELDLLGYDIDEYIGRSITDFHADSEVISDLLERLSSGEELVNYPARLLAKDGSIKHVLINSNVAWDGDTFLHTRCFTRDITNRLTMENELRHLQHQLYHAGQLAAVGELGAGIAHELHQPLTAIQMLVETMRLDESKPIGQLDDECELISEQIFRMVEIIDGIRDSARKTPFQIETIPAYWSLSRVLALLKEQFRQCGVELIQDLDPDLRWIVADKNKMQQVFLNLLTNSMHALKDHDGEKKIIVRSYRSGDQAVFEIADTGPGIAPDIASKVLTPFFTTKNEGDGTGLGLALTHSILREHKGDLIFESEPGLGATFKAMLPASDQPPASSSSLPQGQELCDGLSGFGGGDDLSIS